MYLFCDENVFNIATFCDDLSKNASRDFADYYLNNLCTHSTFKL